jgi:hypothetical protein
LSNVVQAQGDAQMNLSNLQQPLLFLLAFSTKVIQGDIFDVSHLQQPSLQVIQGLDKQTKVNLRLY